LLFDRYGVVVVVGAWLFGDVVGDLVGEPIVVVTDALVNLMLLLFPDYELVLNCCC